MRAVRHGGGRPTGLAVRAPGAAAAGTEPTTPAAPVPPADRWRRPSARPSRRPRASRPPGRCGCSTSGRTGPPKPPGPSPTCFGRRTPLSPQDRDDLEVLVGHAPAALDWLPDDVPVRESKALVLGRLLAAPGTRRAAEALLPRRFDHRHGRAAAAVRPVGRGGGPVGAAPAAVGAAHPAPRPARRPGRAARRVAGRGRAAAPGRAAARRRGPSPVRGAHPAPPGRARARRGARDGPGCRVAVPAHGPARDRCRAPRHRTGRRVRASGRAPGAAGSREVLHGPGAAPDAALAPARRAAR